MRTTGRESEISCTAVPHQQLDLVDNRTRGIVRAVEGPVAVYKKPARAGAAGLASDDLAVELDGKLKARLVKRAAQGSGEPFDGRAIGVGGGRRIKFVMDVQLDE